MSYQVSDIVNGALRLIGVLASGETPSTSEQTDGLARLNLVIDNWNGSPNAAVKTSRAAVALSPVTSTYTLAARPLLILSAAATANSVTQPVQVCTPDQWSMVSMQRGIVALWPAGLICDYAYPAATITVAPFSSATLDLVFVVPAFTTFAAQTDVVDLPPGYMKALQYALAVDWAPEFGRPLDAGVVGMAQQAAGQLASLNQYTRSGAPPAAAAE